MTEEKLNKAIEIHKTLKEAFVLRDFLVKSIDEMENDLSDKDGVNFAVWDSRGQKIKYYANVSNFPAVAIKEMMQKMLKVTRENIDNLAAELENL